jgi:hypothetical protein
MKQRWLISIGLILALLSIISIFSFWQTKSAQSRNSSNSPTSSILAIESTLKSESNLTTAIQSLESANNTPVAINLTRMLQVGIKTQRGILQSKVNTGQTETYGLSLNGHNLPIHAITPIELVKGFQLGEQQIFLFALYHGGQCAIQYQLLNLSHNLTHTVKPFGNCLPLISAELINHKITIILPYNNPYLGQNIIESYVYDGKILKLISPPSNHLIQKHQLTADEIINQASNDGCYTDGILLDSNACGGGQKYCLEFKQLTKTTKISKNYQILQDFCN